MNIINHHGLHITYYAELLYIWHPKLSNEILGVYFNSIWPNPKYCISNKNSSHNFQLQYNFGRIIEPITFPTTHTQISVPFRFENILYGGILSKGNVV